jgi:chemotaxis protein CheZ
MDAKREADLARTVRETVRGELEPMFAELRGFVDRRIAELSAEVNGAVQMVDYSEANLTGQIARMQEELQRMIAVPSNATRNSGLELEAVVQVTESAANQIMEAAESIGTWIQEGSDPSKLEAVTERVNSIFEACSFQDLTGQRIRRAIQHLQQVESMLTGLGGPGEAQPASAAPEEAKDLCQMRINGPDLAQDEIDKLLA